VDENLASVSYHINEMKKNLSSNSFESYLENSKKAFELCQVTLDYCKTLNIPEDKGILKIEKKIQEMTILSNQADVKIKALKEQREREQQAYYNQFAQAVINQAMNSQNTSRPNNQQNNNGPKWECSNCQKISYSEWEPSRTERGCTNDDHHFWWKVDSSTPVWECSNCHSLSYKNGQPSNTLKNCSSSNGRHWWVNLKRGY
jgi:hypothetical protein